MEEDARMEPQEGKRKTSFEIAKTEFTERPENQNRPLPSAGAAPVVGVLAVL